MGLFVSCAAMICIWAYKENLRNSFSSIFFFMVFTYRILFKTVGLALFLSVILTVGASLCVYKIRNDSTWLSACHRR